MGGRRSCRPPPPPTPPEEEEVEARDESRSSVMSPLEKNNETKSLACVQDDANCAIYTENPNPTLAFAMDKSCFLTGVNDAQMAKKCTRNDKQDDTTFQIMDCVFTHGLEMNNPQKHQEPK